jgi:hypothetical protein
MSVQIHSPKRHDAMKESEQLWTYLSIDIRQKTYKSDEIMHCGRASRRITGAVSPLLAWQTTRAGGVFPGVASRWEWKRKAGRRRSRFEDL